jgi:hypothetical protein
MPARQLDKQRISYEKIENAFISIEDYARAIKLLNPDDSALCRAVICGEQNISEFRPADIAHYPGVV